MQDILKLFPSVDGNEEKQQLLFRIYAENN
jgi:hypothetical protein